MNPTLLAELSRLFSAEAFQAERTDLEEADRLWDIANELSQQGNQCLMNQPHVPRCFDG